MQKLLLALLLALPLLAHDITGKWEFDVQTGAGSGNPTFVFKQAGEKLTGSYNGMFGTAELTGTVKGDAVEFSFEVAAGDRKARFMYKGSIVTAKSMKGELEIPEIGKGTWTGTKKD